LPAPDGSAALFRSLRSDGTVELLVVAPWPGAKVEPFDGARGGRGGVTRAAWAPDSAPAVYVGDLRLEDRFELFAAPTAPTVPSAPRAR
jgi:hypothetical protein